MYKRDFFRSNRTRGLVLSDILICFLMFFNIFIKINFYFHLNVWYSRIGKKVLAING